MKAFYVSLRFHECVPFTDAIREMRKYSGELADQGRGEHGHHLDAEMQAHMRLFRAQRNFYISGFSLFLWVLVPTLLHFYLPSVYIS